MQSSTASYTRSQTAFFFCMGAVWLRETMRATHANVLTFKKISREIIELLIAHLMRLLSYFMRLLYVIWTRSYSSTGKSRVSEEIVE